MIRKVNKCERANQRKEYGRYTRADLYESPGLLLQRSILLRCGGDVCADFAVFSLCANLLYPHGSRAKRYKSTGITIVLAPVIGGRRAIVDLAFPNTLRFTGEGAFVNS